jgi:neutral ceramidase
MQINTRIGHIVVADFLCSVSSFAGWQAGVARVGITPSQSIWMGGYAASTHPSEGVRQHIFVKALALKDESGAVTALVTSDLLGFPGEVPRPFSAACRSSSVYLARARS